MDITELLAFAVKNKASDLHLSAGLPPMIRVHGDIRRINLPPMEHEDVHAMVYDIMSDAQRKNYEEMLECDFSFAVPNLARFRVNAFNQSRGAAAAFRTIPSKVLSLEELNAPKVFAELDQPPARPDPVHRADRLGQVDDAGGDGQPRQRERVRPHPDDRGPDRVRARVEEVPDQPARGRAAHAVVRQRAARGAARGPRLHPGRRNARPRDDPPRAHRRRDRPPGVRHAAHELGGEDDRPHHRRVPRRRKGHGARDAVGVAGVRDRADAAARPRTARAAWRRTRS